MQSTAPTVAAYLRGLPGERRKTLSVVRNAILTHLPRGYEEAMQYGMIGYGVSLRLYPSGYLGDPTQRLPYAGLAAQKRFCALYLMGVYGDPATERWFRGQWKATGKKLDMGKSCVRFQTLDDLPLDLIGKVIARIPAAVFIARYEASRRRGRR